MIGGRRVKIRIAPFKDPEGYTYGQYFHDEKTIQLNDNMDDTQILETLRHEMMEAALLISGVGFSDAYEQEAVVRCMEEIFFPAWGVMFKKIAFNNEA